MKILAGNNNIFCMGIIFHLQRIMKLNTKFYIAIQNSCLDHGIHIEVVQSQKCLLKREIFLAKFFQLKALARTKVRVTI